MYVFMQIFFKLFQHRETNLIGCAGICRGRIVIGQSPDGAEPVAFGIMLVFHLTNGIAHGAKRAVGGSQFTGAHMTDVWE